MKWFSLFSGIGGFDLALQNTGHEIVGACEIDGYARETYQDHFRGVTIWHDATKINPGELPNFDGLCAGFPCQAFSIAGRRLGFEESRGTLFYEIARIARQKRPKLLFLENVKGLLSHDRGKTFTVILSTLDELGYDIEWQVINSKHFVPQNRERVFIIGHLRGKSTRKIFPLETGDHISENKAEEKQGSRQGIRSEDIVSTIDARYGAIRDSGETYIKELKQIGNIDKKGHNSLWGRVYDPDGISATLNAEGGGLGAKTGLYAISHTKANMKQRYQKRHDSWTLDTTGSKMAVEDGVRIRKLTPLECERLQGFPDNWTEGLSDTQRYRQIGNAVTVPVVEFIARRLTEFV